MSLKTCNILVPRLSNTLLYRSVSFECKRHHAAFFSSSFIAQIRCSSTKTSLKDSEKNIKHTIYYGLLTPQIRAVKMFSLSSSLVGILAQPFLYKEIAATGNVPVIVAAYSFIGFFTVVTPVLLHLITKKIHYTEFKSTEVRVPEVPGMFTTFCAKGKALFLDPVRSEYPEHYARIMGYDKPIDFKLNEKPASSSKQN
ncbi:hypothetical protein NQ318_019333 [Aromia moschata]|uniref:Transmembrane protein 70 n=1 Tax=Aromia moschata TaxID=1265417 RepID=A0AAV8YB19_9CUCU|nr:hypothetical protein NQ318_019333 [Aromia moschata]